MVCGSTNQKTRKDEVGWSSIPSSGPLRTPSQDDLRRHQLQQQVTKKMRQWPKRPRGLSWPPKSVLTGIRKDEEQAGHFLYPSVTVDYITK